PETASARIGEASGDSASGSRVLVEEEGSNDLVAQIGIMDGLDESGRNGGRRLGEADEPIDRLGEFGRAAWSVAHLAGDEAWIDGPGAYRARYRLDQRSCTRL